MTQKGTNRILSEEFASTTFFVIPVSLFPNEAVDHFLYPSEEVDEEEYTKFTASRVALE